MAEAVRISTRRRKWKKTLEPGLELLIFEKNNEFRE
jgi:hypothetical protein